MAAQFLSAVQGTFSANRCNVVHFLNAISITQRLFPWTKAGDDHTIELLLIVIQKLFQDHHWQDGASATEDSVEVAVYVLRSLGGSTREVNRVKAIQKHAIYALFNAVQIGQQFTGGFQTKERQWYFWECFGRPYST
jgi:hypothetical protein